MLIHLWGFESQAMPASALEEEFECVYLKRSERFPGAPILVHETSIERFIGRIMITPPGGKLPYAIAYLPEGVELPSVQQRYFYKTVQESELGQLLLLLSHPWEPIVAELASDVPDELLKLGTQILGMAPEKLQVPEIWQGVLKRSPYYLLAVRSALDERIKG